MAKTPKKEKPEEIETHTDSWERFQKNMDKIVPPKRGKEGDDAEDKPEDSRSD